MDALKNFAYSTIATPPEGTSGTSLVVQTGDGSKFPAAPFNVTIWPASVQPTADNAEIVRVTAKASDTFTITRAQESTSARTWTANANIAQTITKQTLDDLKYNRVSVTDHGAIGDGDVANAATNVTAFRAAIAAAAAARKNLYIPAGTYRVNNKMTFDGTCSGMSVFGDGPSSVIKCANEMDYDDSVEASWTIILDGASNGALTAFRISNLVVDGNRTGITNISGGNSSMGIVGYQDSDFHNVVVQSCIVRSVKQGSGFYSFAVGIEFIDCEAYDNDYHGGATGRSTTIGDADKYVRWTGFNTHDNGQSGSSGYGLDCGNYQRNIVSNLNSYWNHEGGLKFSTGTVALIVRGARLAYNLGVGFQDTDTGGSAVLDLDGIVTHNNGNVGFRVVNASSCRIGSVTSFDNYCRTGASRSGNSYTGGSLQGADVQIGASNTSLKYVTAESLRTKGSPSAGVYLDGSIRAYRIGFVQAEECETYGFGDYVGSNTAWVTATAYAVGDVRTSGGVMYICTSAHTSGGTTEPGVGGSWTTVWEVFVCSGVVESAVLVANNNAGTAASAGAAAFACERTGAIKVRNVSFVDNQGTPTQHSGFYFSSGIKADIDYCHFGTGISAGSEVYSSTSGTVVRFGHNNTGTLVTRARGTMTADGGSTTASVTYPTAISNLGGAVYFAMAYPASADACEANYISAVSRTALTLTCPTTFTAGTGNVSFRYDVQMEIQR